MKLCFFILLLCTSCGFRSLPKSNQIAYTVINRFGEQQSKFFSQTASGLMHDFTNNKIGVLDIGLRVNETLSIQSARHLAINLVNDFVRHINNNPQLKPYISVFPITNEQVSISLSGLNSTSVNCNYVKSVIFYKGRLSFYDNSMTPPNFGEFLTESYDEAVCKLRW